MRLWTHETLRVYRDKLVDAHDQTAFDKLHMETIKKDFAVCMRSRSVACYCMHVD